MPPAPGVISPPTWFEPERRGYRPLLDYAAPDLEYPQTVIALRRDYLAATTIAPEQLVDNSVVQEIADAADPAERTSVPSPHGEGTLTRPDVGPNRGGGIS